MILREVHQLIHQQQLNLSLESKDLEYLLPNNVSNDLSIAYQDGKDPSTIGPIVLTTPNDYSTSESPDHNANATCWEILTLRLGRFAREHIEKHGAGSLTDEMLQVESRRILYGDDDPWNQTSADNPEWLNLFKKAHGIDAKAPVTGISAIRIPLLCSAFVLTISQVSARNMKCTKISASIQAQPLTPASTSTTSAAKTFPRMTLCGHCHLSARYLAHWAISKATHDSFHPAVRHPTVYQD